MSYGLSLSRVNLVALDNFVMRSSFYRSQQFGQVLALIFIFALSVSSAWAQSTTKVVCVGDSITKGLGLLNPTQDCYPSRLAGLLGKEWEVRNYGLSSTTIMESGTLPYIKQKAFQEILAYKPDVVLIDLGANDSKPANFPDRLGDVQSGYRNLIGAFRRNNPAVRVYALLPTPAFPTAYGITDEALTTYVIPSIQNVASEMGVPCIDLHSALAGKGYCFPDDLHPNEEGALRVARTVYQGITGTQPPPVRKPAQGITIMPLGDSITAGTYDKGPEGIGGGYRDQLYRRLKQSGIGFQFVGSAITNASSTLRAAEQDFHEGHYAYKISDLINNLDANRSDLYGSSNGGYWFTGGNNTDRDPVFPDVVLLLAGANDVVNKVTLSNMQVRMTSLLDWFAANRPATRLFVGTLLPVDDVARKSTGCNDKVRAFNAWLQQTVASRANVTLVDQHSVFLDENGALKTQNSPDGVYLPDGLHPSHNGYAAMGDAWFKALRPTIGGPEKPSLLVTSPDDSEDAFDDRTTLREAIKYANTLAPNTPEVPTISFDAQVFGTRQTIKLNGTALPEITGSLVIEGSRAGVTIDAAARSGILQTSGANVTLRALTFISGQGRAVFNKAGALSIENCTFQGNTWAVGCYPFADSSDAPASGDATTSGTASSASLRLLNSTLYNNEVAVFSQNVGSVTLAHCTVARNAVGLHSDNAQGLFSASNTIVAGNSQSDTDTPLASSAFNIIGIDAGLDPDGLKNNGGPTDTIALLPSSPAINAGAPPSTNQSAGWDAGLEQTDQRGEGFNRVRSGRLDVGAYEVQNLAPTATDDAFSTLEDTPLALDGLRGILANDSDSDGIESLQVQLVSGPQHGKFTLSASGAFTYSPDLNWNGTDSFTYRVFDGQFSAQATAVITVVPVNDAPTATVSLSPLSPTTNALLRAAAVASDVEGAPVSLSYTWKKGAAVLVGENGPTLDLSKAGNGDKGERISVTVIPNDGQSNGVGATATVTVANTAPTLAAASFAGQENQVLSSRMVAQDPDQETLRYSVLRAPRYGTLALQSSGAFTYTTRRNWNGRDSFTARVLDGSGAYAIATFAVTMAPVNGAPIAVNDAFRLLEDYPLSIPASALLRNDSNGEYPGEADALRVIAVSVPANFPGTLTLDVGAQKLLFTPAPNWNGTTSFSYTIEDSGKATATAQVTLQVLPVNDAPVAQSASMTVVSATLSELPLVGSDIDGDALSFALVRRPGNGNAQIVKVGAQWLLRYQSKVGFAGTDTVSVVARDGRLNSAPATVTITVTPNSAPQLQGLLPNSGSVAAGSTVVFEQKVSDANGTSHLDAVALLIGNSPIYANARGGATLWFDAITNKFTLTKDDGLSTFAPVALGATLENTQVSATLGTGDVRRDSNGTLTLRWRITFKPAYTGSKSLWGRVEDRGNLSAGFTKYGDITLAPSSQAPRPISSAPAS